MGSRIVTGGIGDEVPLPCCRELGADREVAAPALTTGRRHGGRIGARRGWCVV